MTEIADLLREENAALRQAIADLLEVLEREADVTAGDAVEAARALLRKPAP